MSTSSCSNVQVSGSMGAAVSTARPRPPKASVAYPSAVTGGRTVGFAKIARTRVVGGIETKWRGARIRSTCRSGTRGAEPTVADPRDPNGSRMRLSVPMAGKVIGGRGARRQAAPPRRRPPLLLPRG
jgi:hypothetical protein